MQPQYIQLRNTTPQIIPLDNNITVFDVTIQAPAGVTIEMTLIDPQDLVAQSTYVPAKTAFTPVWAAAPAPVAGITTLLSPVAAIRLTPTADAQVVILQQGIV